MTTPPKRFRRMYIVDKAFQFKYVRMTMIFVVFMTAIGAAASYGVLWFSMQRLGVVQEEIINVVAQAIAFMSFFQLVIAIPFILIGGVIMTHRIIGPFGRIERFLDQLGEGDLGAQLDIRKNDELYVIVEWINTMSQRLAALKHDGKL